MHLDQYEPWALVNAAGYVRVDEAEADAEVCRRENVIGPDRLAKACSSRALPLITFSSDLVFDGEKVEPYVESDAPAPLNVYGKSKADAEVLVLEEYPQALVIRTSAFFGPWDRYNFVHNVINDLASGRTVSAASDISISPTYVPDLVNVALDLLIDGEQGIWHLANPAIVTWAEFARLVADMAGYDSGLVECRSSDSLGFAAARPSFTALTSERGSFMPSLEDSLNRFFHNRTWNPQRSTASVRTSL